MLLFGLFVGLAFSWRQESQAHKRLMLLATVNLLEAAIVRIPVGFIAGGGPLIGRWLSDVFIVLLVIWDISSRRRLRPVTLWGGLLIVASQPLRLVASATPPGSPSRNGSLVCSIERARPERMLEDFILHSFSPGVGADRPVAAHHDRALCRRALNAASGNAGI